MNQLDKVLLELGFPAAVEMGTLRSIAHLFGPTKPRTGIYALVLPNDCVYIGQALEVVRRFSQHRLSHEVIHAFTFVPVKAQDLNDKERQLIFKAERAGLTLTNVVHATDIRGESDLDLVVSLEDQARWLADPFAANAAEIDTTEPLVLPRPQVERYALNFRRLLAKEGAADAMQLLAEYLAGSIPFPRATEYTFWAVSCMPSTNSATWPRYLCLSAGVMELFVVGYYKDPKFKDARWGFFNVASDVLLKLFGSEKKFQKKFPDVEIHQDRMYRDGGQNQWQLWCYTQLEISELLGDDRVQMAAGALALRVMRKRATIYSKYHCK